MGLALGILCMGGIYFILFIFGVIYVKITIFSNRPSYESLHAEKSIEEYIEFTEKYPQGKEYLEVTSEDIEIQRKILSKTLYVNVLIGLAFVVLWTILSYLKDGVTLVLLIVGGYWIIISLLLYGIEFFKTMNYKSLVKVYGYLAYKDVTPLFGHITVYFYDCIMNQYRSVKVYTLPYYRAKLVQGHYLWLIGKKTKISVVIKGISKIVFKKTESSAEE